jgi:hypothetical protein
VYRARRFLQELLRLENEIEMSQGELLVELDARRAFPLLGFPDRDAYVVDRLGLSPASGRDRARLARGLRALPVVRLAYEAGDLPMSAALVIERLARSTAPYPLSRGAYPVLAPEVQASWVERGKLATVLRLQQEGRVGEETLARERLRHGGGRRLPMPPPLSDDEYLASLRLAPGQTREALFDLGHEMLAEALESSLPADSRLCLRSSPAEAQQFLETLEAVRRSMQRRVEQEEPASPADDARLLPSFCIARALWAEAQKTSRPFHLPSEVAFLAMLEEYVLTWDTASVRRKGDAVYIRAGWRCTAPGCSARRGLESHHVLYLSRRGPRHALWNQTAVCGHHHRMGEHGNLAQVRGRAPNALVWRLGRPELGVWYRNDLRLPGPPEELAA